MSNTRKLGSESTVFTKGRGRHGHVALGTSVPPVLKDHLIEYCEQSGTTLKAAIELALTQFLYEVRA